MKRRSSAIVTPACVPPSVKRTKVQAQRKFAQNNYAYSGTKILTKTPEEYKAVKATSTTLQMSSPENGDCELNTFPSLPRVDDLLTFLCFRQTDVLPVKLNYLNSPQFDISPEPQKYRKTSKDDVPSFNQIPVNLDDDEQNKSETNRNSKDKILSDHKKFRSRNLTNKSNSKTARSLALKHNQRLRSKNVVKAKISESKLKSKLVSTPKNVVQSIRNDSNGPSTRNSAKRLMVTATTRPPIIPSKRVTRQNLSLPKFADTTEEVPKKKKSNPSSNKGTPLITSELSVRLENSFPVLPLSQSNTTNVREVSTVNPQKMVATPMKPVTRSTRSRNCPREEVKRMRSQNARSTEVSKKSMDEAPVRTTRSGSALLNDRTRNSSSESKREEVAPINTRPSRRTKEAAAFYMELLGKDLLCPSYDDDDDTLSIESFPEIPNTQLNLKRAQELEKQQQKILTEKVSSRKTSALKVKPAKSSAKAVSRRGSETIESREAKTSSKPASRRASEIVELNDAKATSSRPTSRRTSEIAEPKDANATASKPVSRKTTEIAESKVGKATSSKPVSRRTSEIAETIDEKPTSSKPASRKTSEIVETNDEKPTSMKPASRKTCEIVETNDEKQTSSKPASRKTSEIVETNDEKPTSMKPASRKTSKIVETNDEKQTKPALRRAPEIAETKDAKATLSKSASRRISEIEEMNDETIPLSQLVLLETSNIVAMSDARVTLPKLASRRTPEIVEAKDMNETDEVLRTFEESIAEEQVEKVETREPTSPNTIEVTIKDLTKRQKPEKSVFRKKVHSVKTNYGADLKKKLSKVFDSPIRDLTKSNSVELMKMPAKESDKESDDQLFPSKAIKEKKIEKKPIKNKSPVASSPIQTDVVVENRDESPTTSDVSKIMISAEKKIFRKNDVELKRKSEAFSADNEKSVYAFEPDLPTTSPPFRRLKPVTPPKMSSVGNSVAVQVNFGKDGKVECSSTGDTRVSTTTDSGGDRVFYIPIQTSEATSTLGVAVKLGTDGPNQKIFMSATLVTNSPAFTTNTITNSSAMSSKVETICVSTDTINLPKRDQPTKNNVEGEKTLKNRKLFNTKAQSVKILKLNKNKKVDQSSNVDTTKDKFESTLVNRNKKVETGSQTSCNVEAAKTELHSTLLNKPRGGGLGLEHALSSKTNTTNVDTVKSKREYALSKKIKTASVDTAKSKPESSSSSKNKRAETTNRVIKTKSDHADSNSPTIKSKKITTLGSDLEDREKLPMMEVPTMGFSERPDSLKTRQCDDVIHVPASTSSSSLPRNLAHSKPSTSSTSGAQSVKIVKVNKTKKVESSDHSSGTESPIPSAATVKNIEVTTEINEAEDKTTIVESVKTKSRIKIKTRPQKCKKTEQPSTERKSTCTQPAGEILEAPTFRPSKDEFNDPLEYIESIRPVAEQFGLCRIVPPSDFRPECKVADEMRFTAYNQYVHKMLHRWGPNVKELMAIKKFLATQNIQLTQAPWIGGMEVDLPRLYQTVQQCGGLSSVIQLSRWQAVADMMRIPKLAQDRITKLDDIYCKYLLPYDILSHEEREKIFDEVEREWAAHLKKSSDDELFEDVDECVIKGRTMPLSCFYRIARNTMMMCFGSQTDSQKGPSTATIEREFWNHVSTRKAHICVHSGSIDSGTHGYGFSTAKNSAFRKHPWNLKVLTNNSASILRFLGPLMGVTVPTLHVGMLYSAFCWYRDPHGLPWIEYLHTGADKIWYGIPDEHSERFRDAMLTLAPRYCRDKKIWLSSDTVMIPPPLLNAQKVSLSRVVQQPGQFIVVFPKAFTSSISTGYLVSESVYFAQASWLDSAKQIFTDMRDSCEPSVFSLEQLLISMADDTRPSISVLTKILPLLIEMKETEASLRTQLKERGVNTFEKLNTSKKRKPKSAFQEEEYYECDICHASLFVSLVVNSYKQSFHCLQHAVGVLQRKSAQAKHCKLLYAYTEEELTELVDKVKIRIETKSAKK